jgi:hypothetical protein
VGVGLTCFNFKIGIATGRKRTDEEDIGVWEEEGSARDKVWHYG